MTEEKKEQAGEKTETAGPIVEAASEQGKSEKSAPGRGKKGENRGKPRKPVRTKTMDVDLEERVVAVNRVAKVVKGGRRFSFSALMVVGDKKGRVGFGLGKAKEVPEAIRKATQAAQKRMVSIQLEKGTIPHEVLGEYDAGKILFKPAAEGTGIKAAGACRSILELAGVQNVLTKSLRGNNPHNIVKATFMALQSLRSTDEIAKIRGKEAKNLRI